MRNKPKYSIVVATYNRSKTLAEMLASVSNQTIARDSYEIIIVDDGSTDDTKKVVADFNKQQPAYKIKYLYQKNAGCAKARNKGILNSQGEIIFFTDDDCVVPNNWVEKIADAFARYPEAVGVGGWAWPTEDVLKNNKFYQFYYLKVHQSYPWMRDQKMHTINTMMTPTGNTSNVAYKKSILMKVGLFDENIYFTGFVDWELKLRIKNMGYSVVYLPLHVLHKKEMTLREFFFKSMRQGRGRDYCQKKYTELQCFSEYDQSIVRLVKEMKIWYLDKNKKPFLAVYFVRLFAGLCGKYLNRVLRFGPIKFTKYKQGKEIS